MTRPIAERLDGRVDRSGGPTACWPISGARTSRGYGVIGLGGRRGKQTTAHRVALEIAIGRSLEAHEFALHRCDNPPCVNPAHLFVGTHADNMADMVAKGRGATGDRNGARLHPDRLRPRRTLSQNALEDIRARALRGESRRALAAAFGISRTYIYQLVPGRHIGAVR